MTIEYIDNNENLAALCQKIRQEPWIALDTEFLREKTYYPKFCLLQIAAPSWVACVDPLALSDLSALFEVIELPHITKVFHSCRQDLEIFYQLTGRVPAPLFDTQIAAPLLGIQENPGYAMLVSSFLNINLSKAYTRTDWTERPLSREQIQYAADDVIYLCQIYQIMSEKLGNLGRLHWLDEDFKLLLEPSLYRIEPDQAWLKIKGKNKLTRKQLSIVQSLSKWREDIAQTLDKPRNWLIRDDLLLELAKLQPTTVADLGKVRQINSGLVARYGKTICDLIAQASGQQPIELLNDKKLQKNTQLQEAVLDVLTAVVRIRAEENSLNPFILATRKDLEKLIYQEDNCLLHGWRYSMVGEELLCLLTGDCSLRLTNHTVSVVHNGTGDPVPVD